ncbi:MAG: exodeoxyribonuclease VII large subunit [Coxiellaceae bacterium]|jgi:exodeoxyribonuclease VII large subunit|nr:exodeoxyribonuclease VII large subunit [Coxiellaceae bacterium]
MSEQKILKVSELNFLTKKVLEANFSHIQVEGEISNFVTPSSGHIYFSLKDETAQIRSVMFRQNKFALKFKPQNGDHVIVTAQASLYEVRGDYQLIVDKMELAGEGILHTKFLQLKNRLAAEGLFATKYKKALPKLPQRIGVVTSPTGAVIRDILNVLGRRFPNVNVVIYPVQVQGESAAEQIAVTLEKANKRKECEILILARGGGSLEDLWPFNEEIVARAIFASNIPIVSAIGHETDFTIADFVADLRAPTPSAAAELAVPNIAEWLGTLENFKHRLIGLIKYELHRFSSLLANLKNRLRNPHYYLAEKMQRLDEIERRLHIVTRHRLVYIKEHLARVGVALDAVSPLATLTRGYAIINKDHKIVRTICEVTLGDQVRAQLQDGELKCLVQGIKSTATIAPTE